MKPTPVLLRGRSSALQASAVLAVALYGSLAAAQTANITPITVPDATSVSLSALNRHGHAAGVYTDTNGLPRGFVWDGLGPALDLGTLGGSSTVVNDLNDFGQTTGYSAAVGDAVFRAFFGIGLTLTDLGALGGDSSAGTAINEGGSVAGYAAVSRVNANYHAFLSRGGALTDLGTLGGSISSAVDLNDFDEVAGDSSVAGDLTSHAFFFDGAVLHDVGTLGGTSSAAADLNNLGEVTGNATTANDAEVHAFVYRNGAIVDLGTLGGTFSAGYAINDAGVVAGDSALPGDVDYHGFIWNNGTLTSLGHLGGNFSTVWALNNSNQIVGASTDAAGQSRAFLWQNGSMLDLNTALPPGSGWLLDAAYFINDAGQIAGTGLLRGQPSWFLLQLQAADNRPPVAVAGPDAAVECGPVALDGSGSSDPDGDALAYEWREGDAVLGTTAQLAVELPAGVHTLRLRVTDPQGASAEDEVVVTVQDVTPPAVEAPAEIQRRVGDTCSAEVPSLRGRIVASDNCTPADRLAYSQEPKAGTLVGPGDHVIRVRVADAAGNATERDVVLHVVDRTDPVIVSVTPSASVIGPANKQMVPISLAVGAADNCDPSPVSRIVRVRSSDPVTGPGDKTSPDWRITGDLTLEVRAEVSAQETRTYTVFVQCTDRSGNRSTTSVNLTVQKGKPAALAAVAGAAAATKNRR